MLNRESFIEEFKLGFEEKQKFMYGYYNNEGTQVYAYWAQNSFIEIIEDELTGFIINAYGSDTKDQAKQVGELFLSLNPNVESVNIFDLPEETD